MLNKKTIPIILTLYFCFSTTLFACTTAIISGKHTSDGRPILWKHRDADSLANKLKYFDDGKYCYIGLINSGDAAGAEVWAGSNSEGFSIMNSASYNLKASITELNDQEGIFMKMALQQCASLRDFEQLLIETSGTRGVEANFGVIDALGGAAFYETDDTSFVKFDANDPQVAPFGYLIRTNYSFKRNINDGYGYIRYLTAENLFYQAAAENDLSVSFILKKADRSLEHSLTKVNLRDQPYPASKRVVHFVDFQDYINRFSSASSMIVQGVKAGEPTALTTIWTIVGFPLCAVAVPTWVAAGEVLPAILTAEGKSNSPLNQKARQLKERCFTIKRGSGEKYLNLSALLNQQGDGILQLLPAIEDQVWQTTEQKMMDWRTHGFQAKEARILYQWIDDFIKSEYNKNFGL
ncbi:hypothetical protein L0128_21095 [candidate division KSB1 bacterium]|nr:hypothetical protein [candidate division KSB1 bacterium]